MSRSTGREEAALSANQHRREPRRQTRESSPAAIQSFETAGERIRIATKHPQRNGQSSETAEERLFTARENRRTENQLFETAGERIRIADGYARTNRHPGHKKRSVNDRIRLNYGT